MDDHVVNRQDAQNFHLHAVHIKVLVLPEVNVDQAHLVVIMAKNLNVAMEQNLLATMEQNLHAAIKVVKNRTNIITVMLKKRIMCRSKLKWKLTRLKSPR